jgi:hypothetical protein
LDAEGARRDIERRVGKLLALGVRPPISALPGPALRTSIGVSRTMPAAGSTPVACPGSLALVHGRG